MKRVDAINRQILYLNTLFQYLFHSLKKRNFSIFKNLFLICLLTILTFSSSKRIRKIVERQILRTSARPIDRPKLLTDSLTQQNDSDVDWDLKNFPIDIVYTWVDGSDPNWIQEKESWRSKFFNDSIQELDNPAGDQRFRQNDELYFSVLSVMKFAPWVRKIYIVTNGQRPSWLPNDLERISVITHEQLLDIDHLPTFNSHVIESALHKIPGLSEHYIYFNDDILLNQNVTPDTFFVSPGISYAFLGVTRPPTTYETSEKNNTWTNVNVGSMNLLITNLEVNMIGGPLDKIAKKTLVSNILPAFPGHNPHPQLKSRLMRIEENCLQVLSETRTHKFRTNNDISLASSLQIYSGLLDGSAKRGRWRSTYIRTGSAQRLIWLLNLGWSSRKTSICLNDAVEPGHVELSGEIVSAVLLCYFSSRDNTLNRAR